MKFLKLGILCLLFIQICFKGYSQIVDTTKASAKYYSSINFNLLGDLSFAQLSYDYFSMVNKDLAISIKFGLGLSYNYTQCPLSILGPGCDMVGFVNLPHHLTLNIGDKSFFEFGLGGVLINRLVQKEDSPNAHYIPTFIVGYRRNKYERKSSNLRIYLSIPLVTETYDNIPYFPLGMTLGTNF